jgi:hypothetical protein
MKEGDRLMAEISLALQPALLLLIGMVSAEGIEPSTY